MDKKELIEPKIDDIAEDILESRYYTDEDESAKDIFYRVANKVGENEKQKEEFYNMMARTEFMPNSPTLFNAGADTMQMLSACFVLPVEDDMEKIMDTIHDSAMIFKHGGGVGFSFGRLREKGAKIEGTGGESSGPVAFLETLFDSVVESVKQGGKRRGAAMGVMPVHHPDILRFIVAKRNEGDISNFNISVGANTEFMKAAMNNENIKLKDPTTGKPAKVTESILEFYSSNPDDWPDEFEDKENFWRDYAESMNISVRDLDLELGEDFELPADLVMKAITIGMYYNGEPGLVWLDEANKKHTMDKKIEATNPCGEQPLLPYESCNLGHVNLSECVKDEEIDFEKLTDLTKKGVRFLDRVIDVSEFPIQEIHDEVKDNRKIGLGVMGFHEMLMEMGIPYESEAAIEVADKVMEHIKEKAWEESHQLAKEKGSFPNWEESNLKFKARNAAVTSIAPTGTTSIISGTSPSIEPVFSWIYNHKANDATYTRTFDSYERLMKGRGLDPKEDEVPDEDLFKTALDVSPPHHVDVQTAFQKHTSAGISKTVNLPADYEKGHLEDIIYRSWLQDAKGLTVYRNQSRNEQVMEKEDEEETENVEEVNVSVSMSMDDDPIECAECGSENLAHQENCVTCQDCGWSPCSAK